MEGSRSFIERDNAKIEAKSEIPKCHQNLAIFPRPLPKHLYLMTAMHIDYFSNSHTL